jgi:hypothetical protein
VLIFFAGSRKDYDVSENRSVLFNTQPKYIFLNCHQLQLVGKSMKERRLSRISEMHFLFTLAQFRLKLFGIPSAGDSAKAGVLFYLSLLVEEAVSKPCFARFAGWRVKPHA